MLETIGLVFERISKYNFTINLDKCIFFKKEIEAFGFSISRDGFKPLRDRIEKLQSIPTPTSKRGLQKGLGALNYYRNSIPNYKTFAAPLYERISKFSKNDTVVEENWRKLLEQLANVITRNKPDTKYPLTIKCDSSNYVTGCVISQLIADEERIILVDQFILKGRIKLAKISHKELFAVYIVFKTHRYLIEQFDQINVFTDNRQVYLTLKNINSVKINLINETARYICYLSQFNIIPRQIKGNTDEFFLTDSLSRSVKEDLGNVCLGDLRKEELLIPNAINNLELKDVFGISNTDSIHEMVKKEQMVCGLTKRNGKDYTKTEMVNGQRFDVVYDKDGKLVVPESSVHKILHSIHVHEPLKLAFRRMQSLNLTWKGLHSNIEQYHKGCISCASINTKKSAKDNNSYEYSEDFGHLANADVVHINKEILSLQRSLFRFLIGYKTPKFTYGNR